MKTNSDNFEIVFFGTDDLFQARRPEEIVATFMQNPLFRPTHYGTGDDDMIEASSSNANSLSMFWKENGFLQLARKDKVLSYEVMVENVVPAEGRFQPAFSLLGITIKVSPQVGWNRHPENLRQFVMELASAYRPCYGCCRQINGARILWNLKKNGIPDIFWLNFFGPPYIEAIGMDKFNSVPCANCEIQNWGGVLVETKDPSLEQSHLLKKHLGRRLFVGGGGLFRGVSIPHFNFPTGR